jgi:hypothetical protein
VGRPELHQTLTALLGAVPLDAAATVVEVDLEVPMEVTLSRRGAALVVLAAPGHTRFISGLLPVVHRTRLHIVAEEDGRQACRVDGFCGAPPEGWSS